MSSILKPVCKILFFIIILTGSLLSYPLYGQISAELPRVIGPSPEGATLGKFADPTSANFRGEASINVPLFDYKIGRITIPLNLSYDASGFRVDALSSSVGLGWALNAGGIITRTVKGQPDFSKKRLVPPVRNFYPNNYKSNWLLMDSIDIAHLDTEPDIFSFNFMNKTGKFIFFDSVTAYTIPFQKIKISNFFTITDEVGVKYVFTAGEQSEVRDECTVGESNPRNDEKNFSCAWYLSTIINEFGDSVFIEYDDFTYQFKEHRSQSKQFATASGLCTFNDTERDCVTIRTVWGKRIKRIWNNRSTATVEFVYGASANRQDVYVVDYWIPNTNATLDSIILKSSENVVVNSFKLGYDYFRSGGYDSTAPVEEKSLASRLKLVSVTEIGKPAYRFYYDEETNLPPRLSFAQDDNGYYNGKHSNTTLIPSSTLLQFNGADRSADSAYMKANLLKKIIYPTGGETNFVFESNYGSATTWKTFVNTVGAQVSCNTGCRYKIDSFVVAPSDGSTAYSNFKLTYTLPNANGERAQGSLSGPDSFFMALTGEAENFPINQLAPGKYFIEIEKPTNVSNAFVYVSWSYARDSLTKEPAIGGGMRVRKIFERTENNIQSVKVFNYNFPGTDSSSYFDNRSFKYSSNARKPASTYNGCGNFSLCFSKILSSEAVPRLFPDYFNAYGYQYVTVLFGDSAENGKEQFKYSTSIDDIKFPDTLSKSDRNNQWAKGHLLEHIVYKKSGTDFKPLQKSSTQFTAYFDHRDFWDTLGLYNTKNEHFITGLSYTRQVYGTDPLLAPWTNEELCGSIRSYDHEDLPPFPYPEFDVESYVIPIVWMHKSSDTTTVYDLQGEEIRTVKKYSFENAEHIRMTSMTTYDSKGRITKVDYKYPADFLNTDVYDTMRLRNNVSPIVEQKRYIDQTLIETMRMNYALYHGNKFSEVQSATKSLMNNSTFTLYTNDSIDIHGNVVQVDVPSKGVRSYIWDYQCQYPIAEISNAPAVKVAYTSFESEGVGNWSSISGTVTSTKSFTGKKCFSGSLSKEVESDNYLITLWVHKDGSASVNNSVGAIKKEVGDWKLLQWTISGPTVVTVTGALIDELRLYPQQSQVTTYTYEPLVGQTSVCSSNNVVTRYEYDENGRLKMIRDESGNIIKSYNYNYKQIP